MSNTVRKFILPAVVGCLLIASVVLLNLYPSAGIGLLDIPPEIIASYTPPPDDDADNEIRLELMFSHQEHFYDDTIEVSVFATIPGAVIHYTLDSSEPTTSSPKYRAPIVLKPAGDDDESPAVYPLKAIAVYGDNVTRPLVHTYFIDENIHDRFDTLVFSLSTDEHYLYDYDTGILVEGRERDDYKAANPRARIEPPAPANFNWRGFESERPVYVEIFEPDGTRVIAQGAGVRVFGGWSRAELYKPLRISARRIYEPDMGRFRYDFFPNDVKDDGFDTPIIRYDQILLGNQANDRNFSMVRREVNYALAREAGLRVVSPSRPAAVFVNGEYYGFSWLQVRINEQYLADVYSAPTEDFQIASRGETWITSSDPATVEAIEEFNAFYDKDFTDDKVLAAFEELVDLDNLMRYYAFQTYLGNRDWPGGNLRRFRYIGPQEDEYGEPLNLAPELDGRWRYVTFDLDFTLSLYIDNVNSDDPAFRDTLNPHNPRFSRMLSALFQREDMVDMYAMYVCDIASNILTPENIAEQTKLHYALMKNELSAAIDAGRYAHWVSLGTVESNHANMIKYIEGRPEAFLGGMRDYFEWDEEMFTVIVSGGDAIIGTQRGASSAYFAHLQIPLKPAGGKYTVFDHWVVNGEIISTPEITVSAADATDGVVNVELVTYEQLPQLQIVRAYGNSGSNGAVLENTSSSTANTNGLYLTYDLSNPNLWAIPAATVEPGEVLEFAGRSSRDESDLHKIMLGFNVRPGRVLFLCNEDGDVLDWLQVSGE